MEERIRLQVCDGTLNSLRMQGVDDSFVLISVNGAIRQESGNPITVLGEESVFHIPIPMGEVDDVMRWV